MARNRWRHWCKYSCARFSPCSFHFPSSGENFFASFCLILFIKTPSRRKRKEKLLTLFFRVFPSTHLKPIQSYLPHSETTNSVRCLLFPFFFLFSSSSCCVWIPRLLSLLAPFFPNASSSSFFAVVLCLNYKAFRFLCYFLYFLRMAHNNHENMKSQ